jgi:hypothetical protein
MCPGIYCTGSWAGLRLVWTSMKNLVPCWGSNTEPNYYNRLILFREFNTMYVKILGKKML